MKVSDVVLACAGTTKIQIFKQIDGEEAQLYDGPWNTVPGSLEDEYVEELGAEDKLLKLYIY